MSRILGLGLALGLAALIAPAQADPGIQIQASNWQFSPNTITVHAGQLVTLEVKSVEGVHALISEDLGIKSVMLLPGKTVEVTFTAPQKWGTYHMHCHLPCGQGHDKMVATVEVLP